MARPVCDPPFALYREEVERMADAPTPFGELEDAIDETELATDEKAALWMLAWSLIGPEIQREETEAKLALVGAESAATPQGSDWSRW